MVGGKIADWFIKDSVICILVSGTGCEKYDNVIVRAKYDTSMTCMKTGDPIWWHSDKMFMTLDDKELIFDKISTSYGDKAKFDAIVMENNVNGVLETHHNAFMDILGEIWGTDISYQEDRDTIKRIINAMSRAYLLK